MFGRAEESATPPGSGGAGSGTTAQRRSGVPSLLQSVRSCQGSFHRSIATSAVLRPCRTILGISLLLILLTTLSFVTREDYPEGDGRTEDAVDMWRVRHNDIMRVQDAFDAAKGRRALWMDGEGRFETDREWEQRTQTEVYPDRRDVEEILFGDRPPESTQIGGQTQIFYRNTEGGKIFTPGNLRAMCLLERLWHDFADNLEWREGYYLSGGRISRMVQLLAGNSLQGDRENTFPASDCDVALTQAAVDAQVEASIYAPYRNGDTGLGFFLGKGFDPADPGSYTSITRSGFTQLIGEAEVVGAEGLDALQKALDAENTFFRPRFLYEKWYALPHADGPHIQVRVMDPLMKDYAGTQLALERDLALGLPFTFLAVWTVVYLHTGSLFCAMIVLLFVLFAMLGGFVGYYLLARLAYFDTFLQLTLFVMLAVGADNFFVMWEAVKIEKDRANMDAQRVVAKLVGTNYVAGGSEGGAPRAAGGAPAEEITIVDKENDPRNEEKESCEQNVEVAAVGAEVDVEMDKSGERPSPGCGAKEQEEGSQVDRDRDISVATATGSPESAGALDDLVRELPANFVRRVTDQKTLQRKTAIYFAILRASRRASASMFETSFTTAMAFFSMVQSVVSPVAHFGFFAGFMILSGYLLAVTAFPQVVGLFYLRFERGGRSFPQGGGSGKAAGLEDPEMAATKASEVVENKEEKQKATKSCGGGICENVDTVQNYLHRFYAVLTAFPQTGGCGSCSGAARSTSTTPVEPVKPSLSQAEDLQIDTTTSTSHRDTSDGRTKTAYKFFPVAFAIAILTTGYSVWLFTEVLKLKSPSKPFEFMPETHMMVGFHTFGYDNFLSSGGDKQYRPLRIVWGLDADEPLRNADDFSKWFPWHTNPEPKFYFDGSYASRSMTDPAAVRHILRVGERLRATACGGLEICAARHPSGMLFVPGTVSCAVRNVFKVGGFTTSTSTTTTTSSTTSTTTAAAGAAGANSTWGWSLSGGGGGQQHTPKPPPLASLYYNVPDAALFSPTFDYLTADIHTAPSSAIPGWSFAPLTRPLLVAEAVYRSRDFSWARDATDSSLLDASSYSQRRKAMGGSNFEAELIELHDTDHPGAGNYSGRLFRWNATYWGEDDNLQQNHLQMNVDFRLYGSTFFPPVSNEYQPSFTEMDGLYKTVQRILDEENARAPAALGKAVQLGQYGYYVLNLELRNTLFSGLLLMIPLCLALLVVASGNLIVSALAIWNVSLLTAQVMGYFNLLGWELGLLESLAGIIVIGLAMDYTLHFCHVFTEAGKVGSRTQGPLFSREQRVEHAYLYMGPTIFAGFVTSASAGLFLMLFSITPFFKQMGVAIFLTILSSVYMSLCYLPCLLLLCGPEGRFGDFGAMAGAVRKMLLGGARRS